MFAIREATEQDAAAIASLVSELGYPSSTEQMRARLRSTFAHPDYFGFVACDAHGVLGFVGLSRGLFYERDGVYGRIAILTVAGLARGVGVGTALVLAAERAARGFGAKMVVVNSGVQRAPAHAFYVQRGYAASGKAFYKELPE